MGKERSPFPPFPHLQDFVFSVLGLLVLFLFLQVIEGKLAPFLGKVIKFATAHVYSCSLCSQKGFICEICNNGEILYPFEDISTSRYGILCSTEMYLRVVCAFVWPDQDSSKHCLSPTGTQVSPCFCTAFSPLASHLAAILYLYEEGGSIAAKRCWLPLVY